MKKLTETAPEGEHKDGFYCEQYNSVKAASGDCFKNYAFLGKGGSGTVYLVQATSGKYKGGLFALKGLHKDSDAVRRRRFLAESQFLKKIDHPNLMQLIDKGEHDGRPFIIQPYAPKTLRQALGGRELPFGKALVFTCQLLSALQALHEQNVIHRDIKPENIFVDGAFVQLGDFGLIKQLEPAANEEDRECFRGYCAGAFYYRTPELLAYAKGEAGLDLRSDIFQLGLVIAEMFSGRNPLEKSENWTDNITLNLNTINSIKGKYGKRVCKVIEQLLKKDPNARISIDRALDRFDDIFAGYAKDYYELHGRFFLG